MNLNTPTTEVIRSMSEESLKQLSRQTFEKLKPDMMKVLLTPPDSDDPDLETSRQALATRLRFLHEYQYEIASRSNKILASNTSENGESRLQPQQLYNHQKDRTRTLSVNDNLPAPAEKTYIYDPNTSTYTNHWMIVAHNPRTDQWILVNPLHANLTMEVIATSFMPGWTTEIFYGQILKVHEQEDYDGRPHLLDDKPEGYGRKSKSPVITIQGDGFLYITNPQIAENFGK